MPLVRLLGQAGAAVVITSVSGSHHFRVRLSCQEVRSELEPLAQLIAIADTDVVARLRLQRAIRDLLASWIRAALVATLLRPFRDGTD